MKNILLIDDDLGLLKTLGEELSSYEVWNILTAENGKQGADIIASHPIDLVVTDLSMPVMDGYELLALLREKWPTTPVIVMTADDSRAAGQRLRSLGVEQCISKPYQLSELVRVISGRIHGGWLKTA
jgi:DNA-binding response OmpR family regulator